MAVRETLSPKDKEKRQEALETLECFNAFLKTCGLSKRASISPARAMQVLRTRDVKELLSEGAWNRFWRAAEVLA